MAVCCFCKSLPSARQKCCYTCHVGYEVPFFFFLYGKHAPLPPFPQLPKRARLFFFHMVLRVAYVGEQANRWWLHLYRLLTGEWSEDLQASNPLQVRSDSAAAASSEVASPATVQAAAGKAFNAPDWPSAKSYFPDWLWSGLVSDRCSQKTAGGAVATASASPGGFDAASLDHARGETVVSV